MLESQIILKLLRGSKPTSLNVIAKIG